MHSRGHETRSNHICIIVLRVPEIFSKFELLYIEDRDKHRRGYKESRSFIFSFARIRYISAVYS